MIACRSQAANPAVHLDAPLASQRVAGSRALQAISVAALSALLLAGCATQEPLSAPLAGSDACADFWSQAPQTLHVTERSGSNQTPGRWKDGSRTVWVTCGLEPLSASSLPCVSMDDVDWVTDPDATNREAFLFGREVGVLVQFSEKIAGEEAVAILVDLAPAALAISQNTTCQ